ncbi:hypothetical protein MHB65_19945 [Lysinibacillus sp. FSL K6-0075]|uniref:hypothetical protein n=1 Tax=Lysinibacillus sp. FSL K6-0075 TaxID=2921415 RepID=UPI003158C570
MINTTKKTFITTYGLYETTDGSTLGAKLGTTSEEGVTVEFDLGDFEVPNGEDASIMEIVKRLKYAVINIGFMEFDTKALKKALPHLVEVSAGKRYGMKGGAVRLSEHTFSAVLVPIDYPEDKEKYIYLPKVVNAGNPSFEFGLETITTIDLELKTFKDESGYHLYFGSEGV